MPCIIHTFVRVVQLCLAASVAITAALPIIYRTRSHTNFSNVPLASCISGVVAFIYALWGLMNLRRQPDSHRWIYLHGLWCLLVCGLLVAGSALTFIKVQQGTPCLSIRDSSPVGMNLYSPRDDLIYSSGLTDYQDSVTYAPGQYCKSYYYQLELACAILGAFAAITWLVDLVLIFGLFGSNGQYGPYRRNSIQNGNSVYGYSRYHARRVDTDGYEEEDRYLARGQLPPPFFNGFNGSTIHSEQDQYYFDMKEQQKREFERNENRTLEDPHGMDGINVITPLSPPPRPNSSIMNKPQLLPDSPYLPKLEIQVKDEKHQMGQDPSEDTEIIPLSLSCPVDSSSLPTLPAPPSPPVAPRAPRQQKTSSQEAIPALQVSSTQPPPDVIGEGGTSPASARYIAYPPSPSCYVFDSSQQKYLPSFVNMAARIDQQSKLVHTSSSCSTGSIGNGTTLASSHHLGLSPLSSSAPTFPPSAATATPRQKVVITGLGRETVGRSCEEIEDKRRLAAASSTTAIVDSTNSLNTLSPSADTVVPDSSSHLLHPQRAVISAGGQGESLMTRSGVGSPTGSTDSHQSYHSRHYSQNQQSSPHRLQRTHSQPYLHSPLIAENSDLGDSEDNEENKDTAQLPSTSQSSEIQPSQPPRPQPVRPLVTKKASLLKRRTSKLTIITPQSPVFRSNSSPRLVSGSSGEEAESPYSRTSSPHPYVGDF